MRAKCFAVLLLIGCILLAGAHEAAAQQQYYRAPQAPTAGGGYIAPRAPIARGINRRALSPRGPSGKPFDDIYRRPTVSPYLSLGDTALGSATTNYFNLVRPQIRREQRRRTESIQYQRSDRRARELELSNGISPTGDPTLRATGHRAYFMNLSHYYGR